MIVALSIVIVLLVINLIGLAVIGAIVNGQSNGSRELERRLTKLEARVDNLPTHKDLTDLSGDIASVVSTCAEIDGRTEAMARTLSTIQSHLMESNQ